ncbi:MAG: phage tail tape measure protein [Acholeplasmataceae bacterium]|nr:phage tail tape measure protein [Acholeplasmataceae bacterium]
MAYGMSPYTPSTGLSEVRSGEQVLNFIISSTNMATPGILAVQAGLANLSAIGLRTGSTLTQALSVPAAGLLAVGGAATLGLGLATYQAAKFEDQLKKMQAVSDLSNTDLSRMSNQVKELAMQYGIGATEIASSMQDIGRAGITEASTQTAVFTNALKMAKIEGMALSDAIEGVITQTNLWGGDISNVEQYQGLVERITTALVHASQISVTDVQSLLMGARYAAGTAQLGGWSPEQTYGMLAYMGSKGIPGDVAGTALRGFLSKTSMEQPQYIKALSRIGLTPQDLWTEGGNRLLDPVSLLTKIMENPQYKALSQQEQLGLWTQLAQQKTSQQILKLKPDELQEYMNKMKEQFDLDAKVATAMDSAMEQFNRLKSTIEVGLINIGETFTPVIKAVTEGLQWILSLLANSKVATAALGAALSVLAGGAALVLIRWVGSAFKYLWETIMMAKGGVMNIVGSIFSVGAASESAATGQGVFAASASNVNRILAQQNAELSEAIVQYNSLRASMVSPTTGAVIGPAPGAQPVTSTGKGKQGLRGGLTSLFSLDPTSSLLVKGGMVSESTAYASKLSQAEVGAARAHMLTGMGFGSSTQQRAIAGTVAQSKSLATLGASAGGATSAITSLGLSLTTLGPILLALIPIIIGVAWWWHNYSNDLKQLEKEHDAAIAKVDELKNKLIELENTNPAAKQLEDWKKTNAELEKAKAYSQELAWKKAEKEAEPFWSFSIFGKASPWASPEEGPAGLSQIAPLYGRLGLEKELGMSSKEYKTATMLMQDNWADIAEYSAKIAELDSRRHEMSEDEYRRQRDLIYRQSKLTGTFKTREEADDARTIYREEQIRSKAWNVAWESFWLTLQKVGELILTVVLLPFRVLTGQLYQSGDAASQAGGQATIFSGNIHSLGQMMVAMSNTALLAAVNIYNAAVWLGNVIVVLRNTTDRLTKDPTNALGIIKQMGQELMAPGALQSGQISAEQLRAQIGAGVDADLAAQGYGAGGSGPGGGEASGGQGGSGAGGSGGEQGGKVRAGYDISFIICSKKTLPPLDPNLFKRRPTIELTQKQFRIDAMHINTADKPEAIQAGVRNAIIDVSASEKV